MPGFKRGGATVLLAGTAIAALLAAIAAGRYARHFYEQLAELKLAPTYEDRYAMENAQLPKPGPMRVVMFGDSRIARWTPRPQAAGFEFVWRGIAGETSSQMVRRYTADTRDIGASLVVIQAGINDLVAGVTIGQGQLAADRSFRNIKSMVKESAASGIDVMLLTVIPPSSPSLLRRIVWSDSIYGLVSSLNQELRTLAGPQVHILDAQQILCGAAPRLPDRLARNTLHLLPAAYAMLNPELTGQLQARARAVQ